MLSFWTASERGASPAAGVECDVLEMLLLSVWGCRRERQRLKSGEGKTVRDFTRMLVIVSSRVRWGLN